MELPAIFVVDGGNVDHAPNLLLAVVPANEHRHQFDGVEAIGFGPASPPADFNRRGVDDDVLNPLVREEAMNPEAIAASFVDDNTGVSAGRPKRSLAFLISFKTRLVQRAGTERILGGWPAPTVKAIFQVPSSIQKRRRAPEPPRGRMNRVSR